MRITALSVCLLNAETGSLRRGVCVGDATKWCISGRRMPHIGVARDRGDCLDAPKSAAHPRGQSLAKGNT